MSLCAMTKRSIGLPKNRLHCDWCRRIVDRPPSHHREGAGIGQDEIIAQGRLHDDDAAGELSQDTLLDEQYFRQIMLNLILNAIDASQGGEQVLVNATAVNGSIAIEVSDRGPGLTPEQQEHLFEPFYTTKTTGHGLGLAVSRELAQSMGASLSWRSEPGQGATFVLGLKRNHGL